MASNRKKTRKSEARSAPDNLINLETYSYRVLKQVHPNYRISRIALQELSGVLNVIGSDIVCSAYNAMKAEGKTTITSRTIQSSVRLRLPGELAKHAVSEGTKAITKYQSSTGGSQKYSVASRAGLQFPPARCRKFLGKYKARVGTGAPIYLAAVLEYLAAEILELAGYVTRDAKMSTIKTRHIQLAMHNDDEICKLFSDMKIKLAGGMGPYLKVEKSAEKISKAERRAISKINKAKKESDQYTIRKMPFVRLVREVGQEYSDDLRFTTGSLAAIQTECEGYMKDLMGDANLIAINAGRIRVLPKDIHLALKVRGDNGNKC